MNAKNYLQRVACFSATACLCIVPAHAATVPFTFDVIYDAFVSSPPSAGHLTVDTTASGSGTYSPFAMRHTQNLDP